MKAELMPADRVRVIQNKKPLKLGDTLYEVVMVSGFACMIRECGTLNKLQRSDTSLLMKVSQ